MCFHIRNDGFHKNGFVVSYHRTAGTWKPEYSGVKRLHLETIIYNFELKTEGHPKLCNYFYQPQGLQYKTD